MVYRAESGITEKASRESGALTFFPEGRTYSPPIKSAVYCLRQSCALRGYKYNLKGADCLSPYIILKQKSSQEVQGALR